MNCVKTLSKCTLEVAEIVLLCMRAGNEVHQENEAEESGMTVWRDSKYTQVHVLPCPAEDSSRKKALVDSKQATLGFFFGRQRTGSLFTASYVPSVPFVK